MLEKKLENECSTISNSQISDVLKLRCHSLVKTKAWLQQYFVSLI